MDLWIRSQNRTKLLKADNLDVKITPTGYCIFVYSVNKEYCIGNYSSFERTIEILSDIEEKIVINNGYLLLTNSGIKPNNIKSTNYCVVYEMPEK